MCSGRTVEAMLQVDPTALTGVELTGLITDLDSVRSRIEAATLASVGVWDGRGEWGLDGARSGAAWLSRNCDMRRGTAIRLCRDARELRRAPVTASACSTHGTAKVRAMLGFVNDRTRDEYRRNEAFLLSQAENLTVDETIKMMRFWAMHADPDGVDPADRTTNETHLTKGFDGRWRLDGNLDADTGATLDKALRDRADQILAAYRRCNDGITRSYAQLMAEALAALVRDASLGDTDGRVPAQPSVTVIVDYDLIVAQAAAKSGVPADLFERNCHIGGTDPIRGETARRLACDAGINRLITKGGSIIRDAGRTTRTATPAQRKAMRARSPGCEFPGCDLPHRWCDAHHIDFWDRDHGQSNTDNMAWACNWHHHLLHEAGWTMTRLQDGTIQAHHPDGTPYNPCQTAA